MLLYPFPVVFLIFLKKGAKKILRIVYEIFLIAFEISGRERYCNIALSIRENKVSAYLDKNSYHTQLEH